LVGNTRGIFKEKKHAELIRGFITFIPSNYQKKYEAILLQDADRLEK